MTHAASRRFFGRPFAGPCAQTGTSSRPTSAASHAPVWICARSQGNAASAAVTARSLKIFAPVDLASLASM